MKISRRILLAAIPLAGCKTGPTTSQIATDVNLIASGLQPVAAALSTAPNVSADVVAKVQSYLSIIQADAAKIAAATANPPADVVQEVVQTVQAFASIASTIPALAPYAVIIQAAVALLPVILASAGLKVSGAAPSMPPTQARAVLSLSAHQ